MKEINKTIYKIDSKGKVRVLTISTRKGILTQEAGLHNGKLVIHQNICKPKNIGKSNETTSQQQAIFEAKAKIKKKLDGDYFLTIEEAKNTKIILPMLAKDFHKEKNKVDWNTAYVQPKLDGMRCLDKIEGKVSRKNLEIKTMGHIVVRRPGELSVPVDGELYVHGLSFQENMKLIKKIRPASKEVKHFVYDVISDLPFIDRYALLSAIVDISDNLELVPTYKVKSFKELQKYHAKFISEGYEGTMLRWGKEGYKINGRSSNLLKYKDFQDLACLVKDIVPSDKNPEQGVVECEFGGKRFRCGMKFSHEERKAILTMKQTYIGQIAEIRFFEWTDDKIPRFPVCVGFRIDK